MNKKTSIIIICILLVIMIILILVYFFFLRQNYDKKVQNKFNIESKRMINGSYDDFGNYYPGETHSIRPLINTLFESESDLMVEIPEKINVYDNNKTLVGYKKYRVQIVYFDKETRKWIGQTKEDNLLSTIKQTIPKDKLFTFVFFLYYENINTSQIKLVSITPEIYDKEIEPIFSIKKI